LNLELVNQEREVVILTCTN